MEKKQLATFIDHTLLKPNAGRDEVVRLCREAKTHGFAAAVVLPCYLNDVKNLLQGTSVKAVTVINFPLGSSFTAASIQETKKAVELGAEELDMVINIPGVIDGRWQEVEEEIQAVVKAAGTVPLKVIIETCYLDRQMKIKCCEAVVRAGAAFVKTSTGFGPAGATVEDVRLIKEVVGDRIGIKASAGIKDREKALRMIEAGANRIGTSSGVQIVEGG